jgi:hypothetical protein
MDLPILNKPVIALCEYSNGTKANFEIQRIKTKDNQKGWQWSGINFNSYFTLNVLSWEYLSQFQFNF